MKNNDILGELKHKPTKQLKEIQTFINNVIESRETISIPLTKDQLNRLTVLTKDQEGLEDIFTTFNDFYNNGA